MAKYIDADTVVSMPFLDDSYGIEKHTVETDTIENLLDRFTKEGCPEPADVVQVVHGKWTKLFYDSFNCNKCGSTFVIMQGRNNMYYCPNCGAKMDAQGEE